MANDKPEPEIHELLADFIKGKLGPDGPAIAKVSWEGKEPPDLPKMPEAASSYGELANEYPIVISGLSRCSRRHTLPLIGGMLTLPEFQANCYRLECLAHLAMRFANGKTVPSAAQLAAWFNQLNQGTCGRLEDPAEDVFVANVRFSDSNFRVFEGMAEGNAFYTQIVLNIVEGMPRKLSANIRTAVRALLVVSEAIAERSKLPKYVVGDTQPKSLIEKPKTEILAKLAKRVSFTSAELLELGVSVEQLSPFVFPDEQSLVLDSFPLGLSPLGQSPLFSAKDGIIAAIPSSFGSALRHFVIDTVIRNGMQKALETALANEYGRFLSNEKILNELSLPSFKFHPLEFFHSAEMVVEIDRGRFFHFLFFIDGFDRFSEAGLFGVNRIDAISNHVEKSITEWAEKISKEDGFKQGITLVVGCGWGRSIGVGFKRVPENWHVMMMPVHDLWTLSNHPKFKALDIFRILDAEKKLNHLGIKLVNPNGFLNLFAWMRQNDGHIVPHEKLDPEFVSMGTNLYITITQNALLQSRFEALNATDIHLARKIDGSTTLVRRVNGTPRFGASKLVPFYADLEAISKRQFTSVFEGKHRSYWVESRTSEKLDLSTRYHLSNMAVNWAERVFRHFDEAHTNSSPGTLHLVIEFDDDKLPKEIEEVKTHASLSELIQLNLNKEEQSAHLFVKRGFLAAGSNPKNTAEQSLVTMIVSACAALTNEQLPDSEIQNITSELVGDESARHFHAFQTQDIRDYVGENLPEFCQTISQLDEALCRLWFGWLVRDRTEGHEILGVSECCEYLNKLIKKLLDNLREKVAKLDRETLVESLLVNHEAAQKETRLWKRTIAAVRSLSEDVNLVNKEASDKLSKLNAASIASRILIEIAICDSPIGGDRNFGTYEIGQMMAEGAIVFHYGGFSDAVKAGAMPAKIRISPAGDVLMDHSFSDKIMEPFGREFHYRAFDNAAAEYHKNYEISSRKISEDQDQDEKEGEENEFEDAWAEEFGLKLSDIRTILPYFHKTAAEQRTAVIKLKLSELREEIVAFSSLPISTVDKFIDQFSFTHRKTWDSAPAGFPVSSWQPWRFRRLLSIVARPMLQLEPGVDPTYLFSPPMVVEHIAKFVSDVHARSFDEQAFRKGGKLRKWIGDQARLEGIAFNGRVCKALTLLGWNAKTEVGDGELLNRNSSPMFGDIDVLAWSAPDKRVLLIECKDISFDKTFGEVARRLEKYRGGRREDGSRDDLMRHLDRHKEVSNNLSALSKFVGFRVESVEPMLVFSEPTPLQFQEGIKDLGVQVLAFSDLTQLEAGKK